MKGRRHSAAMGASRKLAQQKRQSAKNKKKPGKRTLYEKFKRQAQQAQTSRAKAAAAAQKRPDNTEPLPPDNIPSQSIGLEDAVMSEETLDWTGGNGGGGGGGVMSNGNGNGMAGGWFANLTPFHKLLVLGGGGYALFHFFGKKRR